MSIYYYKVSLKNPLKRDLGLEKTISFIMQKGKYDIEHVKEDFRVPRHLLMKATIHFESALGINISGVVTVSFR